MKSQEKLLPPLFRPHREWFLPAFTSRTRSSVLTLTFLKSTMSSCIELLWRPRDMSNGFRNYPFTV